MALGEIRFKVQGRWQEDEVARRLAVIVAGPYAIHTSLDTGEQQIPFRKDSGYDWQLEPGNDWWMSYDREADEYILAYRYAHDGMLSALKGLQKFLEWVFSR